MKPYAITSPRSTSTADSLYTHTHTHMRAHTHCQSAAFTNFAIKANYEIRNNNWGALTKIKSVTVGGRMTRNDPGLGCATSCSSPKYVAGGWYLQLSVCLKGTMAIGRFDLMPRSGLEPTVRFDICESAAFTNFAINQITQCGTITGCCSS
jgi:hypothetical protein